MQNDNFNPGTDDTAPGGQEAPYKVNPPSVNTHADVPLGKEYDYSMQKPRPNITLHPEIGKGGKDIG